MTRLLPLLASLFAVSALAQPVPEPPPVKGAAYILVDAESGQVLAERNPDARREPASITKVMTVFVAQEEIAAGRASLDDKVLISERAWRQGIDSTQSRMFIEVGSLVRLEDLLRGIIIQSGNDASVAVAEHIAGSESGFASMMNATAARLGMTHSHFENASGMPGENHYSTARDIATLFRALIREHPEGYAMYSEKEYTYNSIRQFNRNRLLWRDDTVDGGKTGYTSAAGYCLVASAEREGRRLVSVILGSSSESQRAQDSLALLNYGFRFFDTVTLFEGSDPVRTLPVYGGASSEVAVGLKQALRVTVPRNAGDRVRIDAEVRSPLRAPLADGEGIGSVRVLLDDELLREEPLVALQAVPEGGFVRRIFDDLRLRLGL